MFELYFSYNDSLSKKIVMFIYNNNINKQIKINLIDIGQQNNKYKKIPLLIDHINKKIVEKNKIIDYLISYINNLKNITKNSISYLEKQKNNNNSINQQETFDIKPFNVNENKLSSFYGFVEFNNSV